MQLKEWLDHLENIKSNTFSRSRQPLSIGWAAYTSSRETYALHKDEP